MAGVSAILAIGGFVVLKWQGHSATQQLTDGRALYERYCYACHDVEGNIGTALSADELRSYETATRLFSYVRFAMPYDAPGALTDQQYWDLLTHLLVSRGLFAGSQRLTPPVADTLTLRPGAR